jgi:hypothetical protein
MNSSDYIQEDIRLINLYSQSATTYLNSTLKSNVSFNFKNILRDEKDIIYSTIGVSTAQIPVSYYTINANNNTLSVPIYAGTLTIPVGNYNATSLITAMNAGFLTFSFIVASINRLTGKLSFSAGSPGYPISFSRTGSTAWDILGFDTNVASYSGTGSPILSITAPHPLNLLGIQQLRINSSAFACSNSNSTTMGESNLIGVIQSTAAPFGMILYTNQTSYSILKSRNISLIDIQILDENGNYVDFNNIDWTLTFQLTTFRRIPLPSNSTDYLQPILATLNTIQQDLANNPPPVGNDVPSNPPNNDLGGQGGTQDPSNQQQQDLFSNDDNSLDIMSYNKQLPS